MILDLDIVVKTAGKTYLKWHSHGSGEYAEGLMITISIVLAHPTHGGQPIVGAPYPHLQSHCLNIC